MINWWLIALLTVFVWSWAETMVKSNEPMWIRVLAILFVGGLMYMAGVFTELWGVYR